MIGTMFGAAVAAARQALSPPFRSVLWKVLGLTLGILALVWVGLDKLLLGFADPWLAQWPWAQWTLAIVTGLGLIVALAFVLAPISMLVAGFFLDDLAELVEREDPSFPVGRPLPPGAAIWLASKFALVSVFVNVVALAVFLLPGVNALVFFVANAYLFGREYFELAALRYHPIEEVRRMRSENALTIFVAGLFVAAVVAIPIVNLLTPLFGTAFMVRIHRAMGFVPAARIDDMVPPSREYRREISYERRDRQGPA